MCVYTICYFITPPLNALESNMNDLPPFWEVFGQAVRLFSVGFGSCLSTSLI